MTTGPQHNPGIERQRPMKQLRKWLRWQPLRVKRKLRPPRVPAGRVLIASVPRCGSTMLIRAIAELPQGSKFPHLDPFCMFTTTPSAVPRKPFLKTHALAPSKLPSDILTIFLFGDPVAAVLSTIERNYSWDAFHKLGYSEPEPPDLLRADELGYEAIFDSWMQDKGYPVLAVHHDSLWENHPWMEAFIGKNFELPQRRARRTRQDGEQARLVRETYSRLIHKVDAAPRLKVFGDLPPEVVRRLEVRAERSTNPLPDEIATALGAPGRNGRPAQG